MNLKGRIPALATLPLLLIACQESEDGGTDAGTADSGSTITDSGSTATDSGSTATDSGSAATDTGSVSTDTGASVDTDLDTNVDTGDVPSGDTFTMPSEMPDMTTVDCDTATGADAFFCAAVNWCGWYAGCSAAEFANYYDSVESCEAEYASGYLLFAGDEVPVACTEAIIAWDDCSIGGGCEEVLCTEEFNAWGTACEGVQSTTDQKATRRGRR